MISGQTTICPVCLAIPSRKHPNGQCKGRHGVRRKVLEKGRYNSLCLYPGCSYQYLICLEHKELNQAHPHNTVHINTIHELVNKYPELASIKSVRNDDPGARNIKEGSLGPQSVDKVYNSPANTLFPPKIPPLANAMILVPPKPQVAPLADFDSGTAVNFRLPAFSTTNRPSTDTSIASTTPAAKFCD